MAFQNSYNNYIGRQKKNSTGLFKEKIKNSLSGVAVGNDTTKKTTNSVTPNVLGKSTTNNIQKTSNGIPQANLTTQSASTGSQSVSKPVQSVPQVNTNVQTVQPLNSNTQAINPISVSNPVPGNLDLPPQVDAVTSVPTGMMSLEDINNSLSIEPTTNSDLNTSLGSTTSTTNSDWQAIEQLSNNPTVQSMARSSDKTPQQMAQELIEFQKEQLQKDWEQKKAELELQRQQAQESYNQSVTDANNTYKETDEQLKLDRYSQQEDMNIDAQRRGIQYSPQQMALENVANINLNKNLAEASKKRNELLNNLQIQINQSLANIELGLQGATNSYNSAVSDLMSDYQKTMMDWEYTNQQKEDERKWQEEQTKNDQAFQKEMTDLQNKWQAEQNALDRASYKSGGSYSGYSSYGGYGKYSGYSSYTPYNYAQSNSSYGSRSFDFSNQNDVEAYLGTAKEASTDLFNAINYGGQADLNDRAEIYAEEMQKIIDDAKSRPNNEVVVKELENTYNTALNHLFNESYYKRNNVPYNIGNSLVIPNTPVSKSTRNKLPTSSQLRAEKTAFFNKYGLKDENGKTKASSKLMASGLLNSTLYFDPSISRYNKNNKPVTKKNTTTNKSKKTSSQVKKETQKYANSKKFNDIKKSSQNKLKKSSSQVKKETQKYASSKKFNDIKKSSQNKLKNTYKNKTIDKKKTTTKKTTTKKKTGLQKALDNLKKNLFSF